MSEDAAPVEDSVEFDPITSQEEFDKRMSGRLARERAKFADYADLQAKAAKLDELEMAAKTDSEKQLERISQLEKELESERFNSLRSQIATRKGVPAHRISGTTPEELEASADDYLAEISELTKTQRPKSALKSGATGTDNRLDPKERAAQAFRQIRSG